MKDVVRPHALGINQLEHRPIAARAIGIVGAVNIAVRAEADRRLKSSQEGNDEGVVPGGRNLEDAPAVSGGAVQVSRAVEHDAVLRITSITAAGEAVQQLECPAGAVAHQLEGASITIGAVKGGGPVDIPSGIDGRGAQRSTAVTAALEAVNHPQAVIVSARG